MDPTYNSIRYHYDLDLHQPSYMSCTRGVALFCLVVPTFCAFNFIPYIMPNSNTPFFSVSALVLQLRFTGLKKRVPDVKNGNLKGMT